MNKSIRSFKQSAQAGFTLIELVVVIVILGILAATAIPKFVDMATQARVAKVNAVRGTLQSAALMAHAQWVANGGTATTVVTMEGTTIGMTLGYPSEAGIQAAVNLTDYFVSGSAPLIVGVELAANRASCQATYAVTTVAGTPPAVAAVTSGC